MDQFTYNYIYGEDQVESELVPESRWDPTLGEEADLRGDSASDPTTMSEFDNTRLEEKSSPGNDMGRLNNL